MSIKRIYRAVGKSFGDTYEKQVFESKDLKWVEEKAKGYWSYRDEYRIHKVEVYEP